MKKIDNSRVEFEIKQEIAELKEEKKMKKEWDEFEDREVLICPNCWNELDIWYEDWHLCCACDYC